MEYLNDDATRMVWPRKCKKRAEVRTQTGWVGRTVKGQVKQRLRGLPRRLRPVQVVASWGSGGEGEDLMNGTDLGARGQSKSPLFYWGQGRPPQPAPEPGAVPIWSVVPLSLALVIMMPAFPAWLGTSCWLIGKLLMRMLAWREVSLLRHWWVWPCF